MPNHFSIPASTDTVVVVDDDPLILRAMERSLSRRGLRCEATTRAEQARSLVQTLKPSIVMADFRMPDMDGVQMLREVGSVSPGSVRVLMSAHEDERMLKDALNVAHTEYFLGKPFSDPELNAVLDGALAWGSRTRKGEALLAETGAERLQLDAIARAQSEVLVGDGSHRAFAVLLEGALAVTGSSYGFIGEARWSVGAPRVRPLAVLPGAERGLAFAQAQRNAADVCLDGVGSVYGRALLQATPQVADVASARDLAVGMPSGHPDLEHVLAIPLVDAGLAVGVVVVANRPGGYRDCLVRNLEPFVRTCTSLILREASEREHLKTAQELAHARLRLQATFDAALDGQLIVDDEGTVLKANPAVEGMLGCEPGGLSGRRLETCLAPDDRERVRQHIAASAPRSAPVREQLVGMRDDQSRFPVELSLVPIDDPVRGHSFACTVRDLTATLRQERRVAAAQADLQLANEQLRRLARTDGLTGLANRRHFDGVLDAELQRAARSGVSVGLILCDIDFFKELNDRLGHQAGDTYLRRVADLLTDTFRRSGELVARWGGEEFVVLIPEVDSDSLTELGDRLMRAVADAQLERPACEVGETLTVSVGMAQSEPGSLDAAGLLRAADAALYAAKRGGRARAVVATAADPRPSGACAPTC